MPEISVFKSHSEKINEQIQDAIAELNRRKVEVVRFEEYVRDLNRKLILAELKENLPKADELLEIRIYFGNTPKTFLLKKDWLRLNDF